MFFVLIHNVLSIATDFGIVTDELFKAIENTQVLTVESNYEDDLLKSGFLFSNPFLIDVNVAPASTNIKYPLFSIQF